MDDISILWRPKESKGGFVEASFAAAARLAYDEPLRLFRVCLSEYINSGMADEVNGMLVTGQATLTADVCETIRRGDGQLRQRKRTTADPDLEVGNTMIELLPEDQRRAFKELGMEMIPVHYLDELDEYEAKAIELEENIKRVDFTWKETCLAVAEYHGLRQSREEKWTLANTAEIIGLSVGYISNLLQIARALNSGNKRVAAAENIRAAYNVIQRQQRRVVETELTQIDFATKSGKKEKKPEDK